MVESAVTETKQNANHRVVVPHLPDAMSIAWWLTGNRSDAEDVLQESCVRAFQSISQLRGENARSWILAIVRNTAYTWLRKNRSGSFVFVVNSNGNQIRVAAMSALACGTFSSPQRRRSRASTRSAGKFFCAIRRNFSSISASVIGFLKCPR